MLLNCTNANFLSNLLNVSNVQNDTYLMVGATVGIGLILVVGFLFAFPDTSTALVLSSISKLTVVGITFIKKLIFIKGASLDTLDKFDFLVLYDLYNQGI